jgi:hypothetical protein
VEKETVHEFNSYVVEISIIQILLTNGQDRRVLFCSKDEAFILAKEIELIAKFQTWYYKPSEDGWQGANFTLGGEGHSGFSPTPETIAKRSKKMKGRPLSKAHKEKLHKKFLGRVSPTKGIKFPPEFGIAVSARLTGKKRGPSPKGSIAAKLRMDAIPNPMDSPVARQKVAKAMTGKKASDSTRHKQSEAKLGKSHTKEHNESISAANKGNPKCIEGAKRGWAKRKIKSPQTETDK